MIAERQRVATTHGRLIKGQVNWMRLSADRVGGSNADGVADYRAMLAAAAGRLDELETGSHGAGALLKSLLERWQDLVKGRADLSIVVDEDWTVMRAHVATKEGRRLASQLLADAGGFFDLNELHLVRHIVWNASDSARLEAVISPEGRPLRFDRNEKGAEFMSDFQARLRNDGLPRTKVLSGD